MTRPGFALEVSTSDVVFGTGNLPALGVLPYRSRRASDPTIRRLLRLWGLGFDYRDDWSVLIVVGPIGGTPQDHFILVLTGERGRRGRGSDNF